MSDSRFVCEIPLRNPSKHVEAILFARFDFARVAYNHCVTELNRRYGLMDESKAARQLRAETKVAKTGKYASRNPLVVTYEDAKTRSAQWRALYKQFGLDGEFALTKFTANFRKANAPRVRDNAVPVTILYESAAARAWRAFEPFLYHRPSGNGFRGQPRRRPRSIPFTTLTSRSTEKNHGSIQFHGTHVTFSNGLSGLQRSVITLKTMIDPKDVVIAHALKTIDDPKKDKDGKYIERICQLRIGFREVKRRRRWFVQLVIDGEAYIKRPNSNAPGSVGVTIGVRHIAVVAPKFHLAQLLLLDDYISEKMEENQRIEVRRARAQDRSRRAMNPDAFDEKGRYIKGQRARNRSNRYKRLSVDRREHNRVVNETKKTHRNTFANLIVSLGKSIHLPNLPYAKWQKRSGSAMLMSTPASFADAIVRVAKKRGVELVLIDSKKAKHAQRCHVCKRITRRPPNKPVVSRMAECACGRPALQQHIYASFLASQSDADGVLSGSDTEKDWKNIRDTMAGEMTVERAVAFADPATTIPGSKSAPAPPQPPTAKEEIRARWDRLMTEMRRG